MDVRFTSDVEEYDAAVRAFLERDPVRNTVPLGVIAIARAGLIDEAMWSWVNDDGAVLGTASWTPPYELLLSTMPPVSAQAVAEAWAPRNPRPDGVVGPREVAEGTARRIAELTDTVPEERFAERLFRLDAVEELTHPPGTARLAQVNDAELATQWLDDFIAETGVTRGRDLAREVTVRTVEGRLWFWEHEGTVVSFAGTSPTVAGVTRIGPVFTPPEHRGNGYARALVAAVSQHRLSAGDIACCLFTDLANPVSNAIYQQVGYRPVGDYAQLTLRRRTPAPRR